MPSILISADAIGEFFDALSLSNKGNGIYIYSGTESLGEEVGQTATLKGLAVNGFDSAPDETSSMDFFGSYVVAAESNDIEEFYLSPSTLGIIANHVGTINQACQSSVNDDAESQEGDEDFYVPVKIVFETNLEGDTKITVKPATGDPDKDRRASGTITQNAEENLVEKFPARRVAGIIRGEGLDAAPEFVDKTDVDGNPIEVPNGPVTVWPSDPKSPLKLAMDKAKKLGKLPLAIETHHASRIHTLRIGEHFFGAIAPIPLNKADMSGDKIYADSESLNAAYDFTGLRSADTVEFTEPSQQADEPVVDEDADEADADAGLGDDEDTDDSDEEDDDEAASFGFANVDDDDLDEAASEIDALVADEMDEFDD